MKPKHYRMLERLTDQFATQYAKLSTQIDGMCRRDIDRLKAALDSLDEGNCWWATYGIREAVRQLVSGRERQLDWKRSKRRGRAIAKAELTKGRQKHGK